MKVIFLDFNGVLDTYYKKNEINYDNLQRLKRIISETNSKVVITSALKNYFLLNDRMTNDLKPWLDRLYSEEIDIVGFTPVGFNKEEEIRKYLEIHQEIDKFVVIDSECDMDFKDAMIKLPSKNNHGQIGLDEESTEKAIEILGQEKKKSSIYSLKRLSK